MMFPKFWTQSDIDSSMKLDNSGSYEVRSEMEWLVYYTVLAIGFHSKSPNDSSHNIMLFPNFWTQSDIDWSMKLYNSGSCEVCYEMEWLVCCIVLEIGFHSNPIK
ncbi:unnamed protein product [Prunus armeniaca]